MSIPRIASYAMPTQDALPRGRVGWQPEPHRAVLLVHDMQQYFVDFFDPAQPPVPELLANIGLLLAAARAQGVPVIYTAQAGNQNPADRALLTDFWGPGLEDREELTRILPVIAPQSGDTVLAKWRYSAFKRSTLEERLREQGRDQLLICGVYAHIGCLMTAAEAFMLDVQAFLVGDAVADFSLQEHEDTLRYAVGRCAQVCSTEAVIAALQPRPLTAQRLRTDVAEQMELLPSDLADDDDLLLMGLDSVRLMALIGRWRRQGLQPDIAELAETPTLAAWTERLCLRAVETAHG